MLDHTVSGGPLRERRVGLAVQTGAMREEMVSMVLHVHPFVIRCYAALSSRELPRTKRGVRSMYRRCFSPYWASMSASSLREK